APVMLVLSMTLLWASRAGGRRCVNRQAAVSGHRVKLHDMPGATSARPQRSCSTYIGAVSVFAFDAPCPFKEHRMDTLATVSMPQTVRRSRVREGRAYPLGATWDGLGVN